MGRAPCCDKANVKKGPWSPEEDSKLKEYIEKYGTGGNWIALPQKAGLKRCGKSCRLRWLNYLRPNIKHGEFTDEEDRIICSLYASIGSRWSIIAAQLPGRTDNDIKNYWNTKLKKKLMAMGANNNNLSLRTKPSSLIPQTTTLVSSQPSYFPHQTQFRSFSAFDPPTSSANSSLYQFNLLNNSSAAASIYQNVNFSENLVAGTNCNNLLMFGGNEQASCSSNSDGSCSQISYGVREIKQEDHQLGFQQILGFQHEEGNKFMLNSFGHHNNYLNNNNNHNNNNGHQWSSETGLDYQLEDVKQLINSSSCSNVSLFLNVDENKTQQEVMYFCNN